jgi:hypothetical protein
MACKRSGVRVSVAPRFRSSEAIYADFDRLLTVQEVTLSGELARSGVLPGQRIIAVPVEDRGRGMAPLGAKWGASGLICILPQAAADRRSR